MQQDHMQIEASKTVPLEVREDVRHTKRGILSMARSDDPHSGGSSFSILLGPAPHLDMNYAIFGRVPVGTEYMWIHAELPTLFRSPNRTQP